MSAETRKQASEAFAEMFPLPLFMQPAPAHNRTRTSVDAAHAIKPHVETLRGKVLTYLAGCSGATAQEIETALGLAGSTVRPRLVELRETGCVRDSGRTRLTASRRKAVVWEFVR